MALFNKFIPPLNGQTYIQQNKPYVDDLFDPLFNPEVSNYYNDQYGTLGGLAASYASLLENTLAGQKGILGPGMGVLSTFGRTMDKAADPFLGTLTEGVNLIGNLTRGTNPTPSNPLKRVFVDDYDYQGTGLMAAAGNAMARLAGTQTPLDETDFQSLGDKGAGLVIDLATDPGILGSQLARLNPDTMVGKVGQALNSYDDFMAKAAINATLPGAVPMLKKSGGLVLSKLKNLTGNADAIPYKNINLEGPTSNMPTSASPDTMQYIQDLATDVMRTADMDIVKDVQAWKDYESLFDIPNETIEYTPYVTIQDMDMLRNKMWRETTEAIQGNLDAQIPGLTQYFSKPQIHLDDTDLDLLNAINAYDLTNPNDLEMFTDLAFNNLTPESFKTFHHYLDDFSEGMASNIDEESLKKMLFTYLTPKYQTAAKSSYILTPKRTAFRMPANQSILNTLNEHTLKLLTKYPDAFQSETLKAVLPDTSIVPYKKLEALRRYSKSAQDVFSKKPKTKKFKYLKTTHPTEMQVGKQLNQVASKKGHVLKYKHNSLDDLLDALYKVDYDYLPDGTVFPKSETGFIAWAIKNQDALSETQFGQDLLDYALALKRDVVDVIEYAPTSASNSLRFVDQSDMGSVLATPDIKAGVAKELSPALHEVLNKAIYIPKETITVTENGKTITKLSERTQKAIKDITERLKYFDLKDVETGEVYRSASPYPNIKQTVTSTNLMDIVKSGKTDPVFKHTTLASDISKLDADSFTKYIESNPTLSSLTYNNIAQDLFSDFSARWGLTDASMEDLGKYIKQYGTPQEQTWFAYLDSVTQTYFKNKTGMSKGAFEVPEVRLSKNQVDKLIKKYPNKSKRLFDYLEATSKEQDIVIKGQDMLSYIYDSGGRVSTRIKIGQDMSKNDVDLLAKTIKSNIDKINSKGEILNFIEVRHADGTVTIGYQFNTKNLDIKKDVSKLYGMFKSLPKDLEDMTFLKGTGKHITGYEDLDEFFNNSRLASQKLASTLGFKNFQDNYIKYAMVDSEDAAKFWSEYNAEIGEDTTQLNQIIASLEDLNLSERGSLGTKEFKRANLGAFRHYAPGLSTDLKYIHSSTFTKGMLDNTNAQSFFELFMTDNFSMKNNFKDVEEVKRILFAKDNAGKYTGNLNNVSLVSPTFKDGRLTGFKRYNKFNDLDIARAFEEDAVILPDSVIGPLDYMCKKNARLSNKVYAFFNKYITVPFKFGTLANVGFLASNIQDAYLKQATTMAQKYGTSTADELVNVAMSMRHTTILNNRFADIFDDYRKFLKSEAAKADPAFMKQIKAADFLTIDQVMSESDKLKARTAYIDRISDPANKRIAKFYTFLNNYNNVAIFKNTDLEDLAKTTHKNPYNKPTNIAERVIYGNPTKQGLSSYGLFLNNPVSSKVIKSSNQIENMMRTSSIINDLHHQGYDINKICQILDIPESVEKQVMQDLHIAMSDATNAMNAANFDYNNVSDLMHKASYFIPFPTFYLKNITYWLDMMANNPRYINRAIQVHEGLWAGKNTEDEFVAEAKGRGAIPIGQQNKHLTGIVKSTPYSSMFGAFNALNNAQENFAYRVHPIARPITRHLQDSEDVRYRPYNFDKYQPNIKQGDPKFSELSYMFHQLNPYDRYMSTYMRTPSKLADNSYQLSDFLPSIFQPDFSKKS